MVVVRLRSPLRDLAGGKPEVEVDGGTVGEVLRALEREHPRITGWILDEQGRVRRHVNVFVNGERTGEEKALGADDVVQVLPSIAGGGHR
jgi:MoaD family protein